MLTAGCVRNTFVAARLMLRSSATARNISSCLNSIVSSSDTRQRAVRAVESALVDEVQPFPISLRLARRGFEERTLNVARDLTGTSLADLHAVDFRDRGNLRRCAGEERLVCDEQVFDRERARLDRVAEVAGDLDDRIARDARKDRVPAVIRLHDSVEHPEQAPARPIRRTAAGGARQRPHITAT